MNRAVPSQQAISLPPGLNELCYRCGHKLILMETPSYPTKVGEHTYYLCQRCHESPPVESKWTRPPIKPGKKMPKSIISQKAPEAVEFADSPRVQSQRVATKLFVEEKLPKTAASLPKLDPAKPKALSVKRKPHPVEEYDAKTIRHALKDLETMSFREVAQKHGRLVGTLKTWKRRYGNATAVPENPYTFVSVDGPKRYVKAVKLRSGGILRLEGQFNLFTLDPETRTFVFDLIDRMTSYENYANPT